MRPFLFNFILSKPASRPGAKRFGKDICPAFKKKSKFAILNLESRRDLRRFFHARRIYLPMKIIEKLIKGLSAKNGSGEQSLNIPLFMEYSAPYLNEERLPSASSHNYAPYVEAYGEKSWIYACVNVIAETVSSAEFNLKDEHGRIISAHPALDLMYRPNKIMSGRFLRQWITASLELTGNAYVLKDSIRPDGTPAELFPLLSQLVEVIPGKNSRNPVQGYKYRAGSQTAYYKPEEIIHFKYFNPFDFFYGLSPISAARRALETLDKAETFNRAFFDNSGTLSGILQTDGRLDEASRSRIMKAWSDKYQGAGKAHKVALLEGGLKWQNISLSQKDMDFISGIKLNRETILSIFHVPPALVGLFDHAPQFNTKEQQRIFWQTCVHPKQTLILETLTEFLLPDFDAGRTLYFDKDASSVSCLKEDMLELAQAAKIYHEMGYNKAEISQALNLPFGGKVKNNGAKK